MPDDALPDQLKPKTGLIFSSLDVCPQWIPHEFDIATMLANSSLSCLVFAPPKRYRKKKSGEKKLKRAQKHNRMLNAKG
jgi:hypothetical protein